MTGLPQTPARTPMPIAIPTEGCVGPVRPPCEDTSSYAIGAQEEGSLCALMDDRAQAESTPSFELCFTTCVS